MMATTVIFFYFLFLLDWLQVFGVKQMKIIALSLQRVWLQHFILVLHQSAKSLEFCVARGAPSPLLKMFINEDDGFLMLDIIHLGQNIYRPLYDAFHSQN